MKIFNFKHKKTGEIISPDCHEKIAPAVRDKFEKTPWPATHFVENADDDGNFVLAMLAAEELESLSEGVQIPSDSDMASNGIPESDFGGFGGGDGGGGGAGGDFSSESTGSDTGSDSSGGDSSL